MRLDVYVEGLWLEMRVGRIIDTGDGLGRREVVQVASQLRELRACVLFLSLLLLLGHCLCVLVQVFANLIVLDHKLLGNLLLFARDGGTSCAHSNRVRTCGCKIHGSFRRYTICHLQLLDNLGGFGEERFLSTLEFGLFLLQVPGAATMPSVDPLDETSCHLYSFVIPLDPEHSPDFLDRDGGLAFFLTVLLGLAKKG